MRCNSLTRAPALVLGDLKLAFEKRLFSQLLLLLFLSTEIAFVSLCVYSSLTIFSCCKHMFRWLALALSKSRSNTGLSRNKTTYRPPYIRGFSEFPILSLDICRVPFIFYDFLTFPQIFLDGLSRFFLPLPVFFFGFLRLGQGCLDVVPFPSFPQISFCFL